MRFVGRNRGYRKIIVPASERLVGELVKVKVTETSATTVIGELLLEGVEAGV